MKPLKVIMSAFGSYGGVETVDFERMDHGIFLITGDTGAGKTTIFDAITFALFGETSGLKRDGSMMRSQYAGEDTETFVTLEFQEHGTVYEITRSPGYSRMSKRKDKNGEYKSVQVSAKVSLKLPDGSEYPGSIRDVNEKIQKILGVDQNQFSQIAMIAQGDYLKLLHAASRERKEIFARIFNTGIYSRIQLKLKDRNNTLYGRLEDNRKLCIHELQNVILPEESRWREKWEELLSLPETGMGQLWEVLEHIVMETAAQEEEISRKWREGQSRLSEIESRIRQAGEENELLESLEQAKVQKKILKDQEPMWKQHKEKLELAKKAALVEEVQKQLQEKEGELVESRQEITCLTEEISGLKKQRETLEQKLEQFRKEAGDAMPEIMAKITRLQDVMPLYGRWTEKKVFCEKKSLEEAVAEEKYQMLRKELDELKQKKEELEAKQKVLEIGAARLPEAVQAAKNLKEKEEGLKYLEEALYHMKETAASYEEQQMQAEKAMQDYEYAEREYNDLYLAFFAAQAGIMARKLEEGSPCPVCGSLSHPRKAKVSQEGISQKKVEQAKIARDLTERQRSQMLQDSIKQAEELRHQKKEIYGQWKRWIPVPLDLESDGSDAAAAQLLLTQKECSACLRKKEQEEKKAKEASQLWKENQKLQQEWEEKEKELQTAGEDSQKIWQDKKLELAKEQAELSQLAQSLPDQKEQAVREELSRLKEEKKRLEKQEAEAWKAAQEKAEAEKEKIGRLASEQDRKEKLKKKALQLKAAYMAILQQQGFSSEEVYQEARMPLELRKQREQEVENFEKAMLKACTIVEQLKTQTEGKKQTDTGKWKEQAEDLKDKQEQLHKEEGLIAGIRSRNQQAEKNLKRLWKERDGLEEAYKVIHTLFQTANGKLTGSAGLDFQTYVQRQYFNQMIQAANRRLTRMTSGQFLLSCRELGTLGKQGEVGLDLDVYSMATDKTRDVKTLSGGESFLAALAMALGMADVIQNTAGNVRMDAMFIDEGFGSLDEETRMRAICILKELAGERRLIGIISHVQELKEQIGRKLIVKKSEKGSRITWVLEE